MKQRLLILLAIVIGGMVWLTVKPSLLTGDLGEGISLLHAQAGWVMAIGWVIGAGLPAVALGMIVSGTAHPLAGVFSTSLALAFVACAGGPIDGLLWKAEGPGFFVTLSGEMVIWLIAMSVVLFLIARSRLWVRRRFTKLICEQHGGMTTKFRFPNVDELLSGAIAGAIGGLVSWVLLTSTDTGQVFGGLMLGFTLGGLIAQQVAPQGNPTAILLSPCVVAIVAYLYAAMKYASHDAMLASFNTNSLPGLASVLPIYYASVAVAGCALGIGLAQAMDQTRPQAASDQPST